MKTMTVKISDLLLGTPPAGPYGMLARFGSARELVRAARELRLAGYRRYDAHSPYPVHGLDDAMGSRFSLVPFLVLGGGVTGCLAGLGLQIFVHSFAYPLVISGKPYLSIPAFIPVVFELTILFSAFGAVLGMFLLNRLPMHYHPLLKSDQFARFSDDGFFISVEARDRQFDVGRTRELLEKLGGSKIEVVDG